MSNCACAHRVRIDKQNYRRYEHKKKLNPTYIYGFSVQKQVHVLTQVLQINTQRTMFCHEGTQAIIGWFKDTLAWTTEMAYVVRSCVNSSVSRPQHNFLYQVGNFMNIYKIMISAVSPDKWCEIMHVRH